MCAAIVATAVQQQLNISCAPEHSITCNVFVGAVSCPCRVLNARVRHCDNEFCGCVLVLFTNNPSGQPAAPQRSNVQVNFDRVVASDCATTNRKCVRSISEHSEQSPLLLRVCVRCVTLCVQRDSNRQNVSHVLFGLHRRRRERKLCRMRESKPENDPHTRATCI